MKAVITVILSIAIYSTAWANNIFHIQYTNPQNNQLETGAIVEEQNGALLLFSTTYRNVIIDNVAYLEMTKVEITIGALVFMAHITHWIPLNQRHHTSNFKEPYCEPLG